MDLLICGSGIDNLGLVARIARRHQGSSCQCPSYRENSPEGQKATCEPGQGPWGTRSSRPSGEGERLYISLSPLEAGGNGGLGSFVNGNEKKQLVSEHNGEDREAKEGCQMVPGAVQLTNSSTYALHAYVASIQYGLLGVGQHIIHSTKGFSLQRSRSGGKQYLSVVF